MFLIFVILFTLVAGVVVFSPTILYLAAFPRVLRYAVDRSRVRSVLAIYALGPFALWAIWSGFCLYRNHALEQRISAATIFPAPKELPDTLVFDADWGVEVPKMACLTTIVRRDNAGRYDRSVPDRYIELRVGSKSGYALAGVASPYKVPYELNLVENGRRQLLGLEYPSPFRVPFPFLTLYGWWSPSPAIMAGATEAHIATFVRSRLKGC